MKYKDKVNPKEDPPKKVKKKAKLIPVKKPKHKLDIDNDDIL